MKTQSGWRFVVALVGCVAVLAVSACEGDSGNGGGGGGGDTGGGGGGDTGGGGGGDTGGAPTEFPAGTFQLTTQAVVDECLDGGLAILFQPDGDGVPYNLANTTEFPAYDSLPQTFTMALQAPFTDMPVTLVAAGADHMVVEDAVQTDLVVDADQFGDCHVDMLIDADVIIVDTDHITVTANIEVSDWTGAECPAVDSDPCTIELDMTGARQ